MYSMLEILGSEEMDDFMYPLHKWGAMGSNFPPFNSTGTNHRESERTTINNAFHTQTSQSTQDTVIDSIESFWEIKDYKDGHATLLQFPQKPSASANAVFRPYSSQKSD